MKAADWLIDLGPGAADEGGRVVVTGTPEEVAGCAESVTGRILAREFARDEALGDDETKNIRHAKDAEAQEGIENRLYAFALRENKTMIDDEIEIVVGDVTDMEARVIARYRRPD